MKKLLVVLGLFYFSNAMAGVHLEPYLGYGFGSTEQTAAGIKVERSYSYPSLGARVGYGMLGLSAGLDYNMSLSAFDMTIDKPAGSTDDNKYARSNLGVFVAYEFPILLRAFASFYFNSTLETDSDPSGGTAGDQYNGSGFNLGVGFTGLPIVSLNLEFRSVSYDEYEDSSAGSSLSLPTATLSTLDSQEIFISVSAPFNL